MLNLCSHNKYTITCDSCHKRLYDCDKCSNIKICINCEDVFCEKCQSKYKNLNERYLHCDYCNLNKTSKFLFSLMTKYKLTIEEVINIYESEK